MISCHEDSDSDSKVDYWNVGSDSTGEGSVSKKIDTSTKLCDTNPCPIKAIQNKDINNNLYPKDDLDVTALVAIMDSVLKICLQMAQIPSEESP